MTLTDGTTYVGQFQNNERHGQGTATSPDGTTYVGEYQDSLPHGRGTLRCSDGETYEGEWKNGEWHGQGTYRAANGDTYEGEWKNGKKRGQGTFIYAEGDGYKGEFRDDFLREDVDVMSLMGDSEDWEDQDSEIMPESMYTLPSIFRQDWGEIKEEVDCWVDDYKKKNEKAPTYREFLDYAAGNLPFWVHSAVASAENGKTTIESVLKQINDMAASTAAKETNKF